MKDNAITLKTEHQDEVVLWLDAPLVDLARPVTVTRPDGQASTITTQPNVENLLRRTRGTGRPAAGRTATDRG